MLLLAVMDKEAQVASMTTASQLRLRDFEGFCDNLSLAPPPKETNLDRKPLKRALKNYDKMLRFSSVDGLW